MAEQFLELARIGAGPLQMRSEAVAERMRRGTRAQSQPRARAAHRPADDRRRQRAALRPPKQWLSPLHGKGHLRGIALDRLAHLGQQRHDPGLVALAQNAQRLAQRQDRGGQRPRLADAKPRALEKKKHRPVARRDPGLGGILRDILR